MSARDNLTRWHHQKPFYEVYYLKWNDPAHNVAAWLRYTLLAPVHRPPEVSTWGIFFDSKDPSKNIALKNTFPVDATKIGREEFRFASGPSTLSTTGARGELQNVAHTWRWDITFEPPSLAIQPYPALLYKIGFPKTKFMLPYVTARISGTMIVDDRTFNFRKVPGHQGHLWGKQMAAGWSWANGNAFLEDEDFFFEALASGPFTILFVHWRGQLYRMNGPVSWYRNRSVSRLDGWHFEGRAGDYIFVGDIQSEYAQMVGVRYEDPSGTSRFCHNTKTANAKIQIFRHRKGSPLLVDTLNSERTTAFEYVQSTHDSRVRLLLP